MTTSRITLIAAALLCAAQAFAAEPRIGERLAESAAGPDAAGYRSIEWSALTPRDWNPAKAFEGMDFSALSDADPRAAEALRKLQSAWEKAPIEPALDRQRVRLSGFVVPLDGEQGAVREFLLVPYYGACIHTPPPPANQIVHVRAAAPINGLKLMDTVAVSGTLRTQPSRTAQGMSGYLLAGEAVAPLPSKRRRP